MTAANEPAPVELSERPCTRTGCDGTMVFRRNCRKMGTGAKGVGAGSPDERVAAWTCKKDSFHQDVIPLPR